MYRMDVHTTVKTLLGRGLSRRKIAEQLGIHRKVIKRIEFGSDSSGLIKGYTRSKQLKAYEGQIQTWLDQDLTGELIYQKLVKEHGLQTSYSTVNRTIRSLKADHESFVPMQCLAGEEAQVDFGYLGLFDREGASRVKIWVFCAVLSHSRLGYFEAVTDQSVETFIRCHIHAFEFFCGVPRLVRLDNLKSGVTTPDFYEPLIQEQYASFLAHYGAGAVPCRVRTPEHKGKVESGVKYVKKNFLLGLDQRNFSSLSTDLRTWTDTVANRRVHGTTKRVPLQMWQQVEKSALGPLPAQRYEFYHVEERKVTRFGHVIFRNNYYSVPYTLVGQTLRLFTNGTFLRISEQGQEVALHLLNNDKGQYVTQNGHLAPHKQQHTLEYYAQRLEQEIGTEARDLLLLIQQNHPSHWKDKARGLLQLCRRHPPQRVQEACRKALDNGISSYRSVRDICLALEHTPPISTHFEAPAPGAGGMAHELSLYDQLVR
ncbi:IS21 family transposase [Haliscomenobacter hydrossis]|uniref:Integrase catalytic region n=1 Tax=Haliscomenobacter hydrossis (strain ATCC 27775 / DSM 1100 / LMG 10767 / O) TaxID=760192 RepID=F4KU42_HALH1|nr:IS21 family transposase [Haliscomenobacter hydrossis]AEE48391.1 Integrase catalytic region [Haliscomenobacter hydrossis DSM 1100]AEE50139.1 Integrase catalytic region [Haliscomenobacter hydrossis DSM 1100]